jgi:hypothetical protein
MLRAVRLDEVLPALEAQLMFGSNVTLDQVRRWLCVHVICCAMWIVAGAERFEALWLSRGRWQVGWVCAPKGLLCGLMRCAACP